MSQKVAYVTGGMGGIGTAIATRFASEGARVVVTDVNEAGALATTSAITAAGDDATAIAADISDKGACKELIADVVSRFGGIDVLVNNAAWVRYQAIPDVAPETLDRMLDIGFKAVVWGIQAAAEAMDPGRGGAIVNLASMAGIVSARNSIVYSGIKAGIMGITRAAAGARERHPEPVGRTRELAGIGRALAAGKAAVPTITRSAPAASSA